MILRHAVEMSRGQSTEGGDALAEQLNLYAGLLAAQGSLATATSYLFNDQNDVSRVKNWYIKKFSNAEVVGGYLRIFHLRHKAFISPRISVLWREVRLREKWLIGGCSESHSFWLLLACVHYLTLIIVASNLKKRI